MVKKAENFFLHNRKSDFKFWNCLSSNNQFKKVVVWDSPGGPVIKNLPSDAVDVGSIPKIP